MIYQISTIQKLELSINDKFVHFVLQYTVSVTTWCISAGQGDTWNNRLLVYGNRLGNISAYCTEWSHLRHWSKERGPSGDHILKLEMTSFLMFLAIFVTLFDRFVRIEVILWKIMCIERWWCGEGRHLEFQHGFYSLWSSKVYEISTARFANLIVGGHTTDHRKQGLNYDLPSYEMTQFSMKYRSIDLGTDSDSRHVQDHCNTFGERSGWKTTT